MSRGPRKYPARQEFIDAARRAGYTEDQITVDDYTESYYPRGTYHRKSIECVRVRLENGPMGLFKKDTGALYKGESHRGYKLTKTELLQEVVTRSPAALKRAQAEAEARAKQECDDLVAQVWDNYQAKQEIERLALQFAIKTAQESGVDRETATDIVLSLLDSGAMDRVTQAKAERMRAGDGWTSSRTYKRGEWKDGKLVKW